MKINNTTDDLKIVSLNIEQDKHFDRIMPFLKEYHPDVVLMQEVFFKDISFLEKTLKMNSVFAILNTFRDRENSEFGLVTLSALESKSNSIYYRGDPANPPALGKGEAANQARAILVTDLMKGKDRYRVINTHFTWTPDGQPSERQYIDVDIMLQHLSHFSDFVLCGDFNAPRGKPIFDKIAAKYKDNIPPQITTTIDKHLHRAGDLNLVVDGMFTTPKYQVNSIEIISGLSDHCAVKATVSLK